MEVHNPYVNIYLGLGLTVAEGISSKEAQLVATQAAMMHNALGYAIRDLVKVVSYKYSLQESGMQAEAYSQLVGQEVEEGKQKISNHLRELIDSEEQSMEQVSENGQFYPQHNIQRTVVVQQRISMLQDNPPQKRNIVDLEDDDPPSRTADFTQYAYRSKANMKQSKKQANMPQRSLMKCCQCKRLCDPVQHGSNLYCSKCAPTDSVF